MSYPEFFKGESVCAYCDKEIEDEYLTVRDNHMILNYFTFDDGQDNIFCDKDCLADALFAETEYVQEVEK